jgi:hypothetical protein
MDKIDYIICFYLGHRRVKSTDDILRKDKFFFIKKHLSFVIENKKNINNILFIVNGANQDEITTIKSIINRQYNKITLIFRPNINFSYGAWNDGIMSILDKLEKYIFICEDDYIPSIDNFQKYFINEFDDETIFVCQLYRDNHAAISNGMLNSELLKKVYATHKTIFKLGNGNDYFTGISNQISFTNYFNEFKIKDISKYKNLFLNHLNQIEIHGDESSFEIISPITEI